MGTTGEDGIAAVEKDEKYDQGFKSMKSIIRYPRCLVEVWTCKKRIRASLGIVASIEIMVGSMICRCMKG